MTWWLLLWLFGSFMFLLGYTIAARLALARVSSEPGPDGVAGGSALVRTTLRGPSPHPRSEGW